MINKKELRIGNFVEYSGENLEITDINQDFPSINTITIDYLDYEEIYPIPLTEEWLIKFGFERKTYNHLTLYYFSLKVLSHGEICFHPKNYGFNIDLGTTTGYQFGTTNIKHVHQLQNLYFALTNEEL